MEGSQIVELRAENLCEGCGAPLLYGRVSQRIGKALIDQVARFACEPGGWTILWDLDGFGRYLAKKLSRGEPFTGAEVLALLSECDGKALELLAWSRKPHGFAAVVRERL